MNQVIDIQGNCFHYGWLRDHCPCCRYPSPYQQLYNTAISRDTTEIPNPVNVEVDNNYLTIIWDEEPPHKSTFDIPSLLKYSASYHHKNNSRNTRWNKKIINSFPLAEYSIQDGKINDESWLNHLQEFGFILLKDTSLDEMKSFFSRYALLNEDYFGKTFELDEQNKNTKANQDFVKAGGNALPPHNDLTFWGDHKLLQFLYCEKSSQIGGSSILVDGFYVAEQIKQNFPEYFEILTSIKVEFCLSDPNFQYLFSHSSTIFECDEVEEIDTIRFSKRNCRPYCMESEKIDRFYQAYYCLFNQLKSEENQFLYHLEPKDCLIFQNFRILHGRTAFNVSLGGRSLHAGYYDWKYFKARLDFAAREKNC